MNLNRSTFRLVICYLCMFLFFQNEKKEGRNIFILQAQQNKIFQAFRHRKKICSLLFLISACRARFTEWTKIGWNYGVFVISISVWSFRRSNKLDFVPTPNIKNYFYALSAKALAVILSRSQKNKFAGQTTWIRCVA
jgi:hypothetical protein